MGLVHMPTLTPEINPPNVWIASPMECPGILQRTTFMNLVS